MTNLINHTSAIVIVNAILI